MRANRAGRLRRSTVIARRWVTPRIVRLTVAGDLADFVDQGTDQHVAFYHYPPEAIVPEDLAPEQLRELHEFAMPQVRRYTIRRWYPGVEEIDFDVVVHQPAGLAAGWAEEAAVGDSLLWWGPTSAWHLPEGPRRLLLVGDETALPAIDAVLSSLPEQVSAQVVAEVADARDEAYLAEHAGRAQITWVHRGEPDGVPHDGLLAAVRSLPAVPGETAVWAGVEFATAGALRRWFIGERGYSKDQAFIVSYWIHGQAQDMRADARARERTARNREADPVRAREHVRLGADVID